MRRSEWMSLVARWAHSTQPFSGKEPTMAAEENEPSTPDHEAMPEGEEPPPRGVKTAAAVRWVIIVAVAVLAAFMWLSYVRAHLSTAQPAESTAAPKYHCPM